MERMFQGQERLFEEQRKIQAVVSEPVPEYMMEYAREHPAFKEHIFNPEYLKYHLNHPMLKDTEALRGKIVYDYIT